MNVANDYQDNRRDGIDAFCVKNLFTEQNPCGQTDYQGTLRLSADPR